MKTFRLLLVAAAAAVPFLATGASAECARTREMTALRVWAEACVGDRGCVVYQESGSLAHAQNPICVLPVPVQ